MFGADRIRDISSVSSKNLTNLLMEAIKLEKLYHCQERGPMYGC
jgi:hypothetical protein